jgi:hypothetical protein
MLTKLDQKFSIEPIIQQVDDLVFEKRLDLNKPSGSFFHDPWIILPEFESTPLGEVLKSLGNIGQARLLKLESAESYTAHADPDDRIHLAIITNPYSFLVDITDNKLYHLPADGQLWYMNTGKIHVAANWGPRTRIHLNVRVLLPRYNEQDPFLKIKIIEGDYDWKQLAYTPIMTLINAGVKNNTITGFKAISEKEVYLNTLTPDTFTGAFESITRAGVILDYQYCI